jgi:HK97 family phage major capsid protein
MKLEQLKKNYFDLLEAAKTMLGVAEGEKRNLNKEELDGYNKKLTEAETLRDQIKAMEKANELEENEVRVKDYAEPKKSMWQNFGEFLSSVRKVETHREVDNRLVEQRASGLNETVPSEGGFLVPTEYTSEIIKNAYDRADIASRVRKIPVKGNSITIPAVNETSRANGSRWGGVQAYWIEEAGTKVASKPDFRLMELKMKKLIGMSYSTDELLEDTTALDSFITDAFSDEFAFAIDDALVNGTGVGQPLGIMNSPCLLTVAKEGGQPAATLLYMNIVKMWSRMWARSRKNAVWFINQDIEPQLHTMSLPVGVAGAPVYLPAGGASATPYATLYGRPVISIEHCQTLGTTGDIILADYSQYLMIDKNNIKKDVSIHVKFVYDETAFRFVYRCDGQPAWNSQLTPKNGTTTVSPFVVLATR